MARLFSHIGDSARSEEAATKLLDVEKMYLIATESASEESLAEVLHVIDIVASVGAFIGSGQSASIRSGPH